MTERTPRNPGNQEYSQDEIDALYGYMLEKQKKAAQHQATQKRTRQDGIYDQGYSSPWDVSFAPIGGPDPFEQGYGQQSLSDSTYDNGSPAYANPAQSAPAVTRGEGSKPQATSGGENTPTNTTPSTEAIEDVHKVQNSLSIPELLNKPCDVLWTKRGRIGRTATAAAAAVGVFSAGGFTLSEVKDEPLMAAIGFAKSNDTTFTSPSCFDPVINVAVRQQSDYVLNYKNVIANEVELKKFKESKAYKPQTFDSFDHLDIATQMQSGKKPAEPFTKTAATTPRLPETLYDGTISLGICEGGDMSKVVSVDGDTVNVNLAYLKFIYNPSWDENKKAQVAYEKFAPKTLGKTDASYITNEEVLRIRKVVIPNEKDPTLNNAKFDNSIIDSALKGLRDEECLDDIQSAGKQYIKAYLQQQYPDKKFIFNMQGAGIVMPDQSFAEKATVEKNVKISGSNISCENVKFKGMKG